MFGQCPAKIGSWPLRYLWTNAGGSLAGKRQDFYLPLPPLSCHRAAQDREGRKYVSRRALRTLGRFISVEPDRTKRIK